MSESQVINDREKVVILEENFTGTIICKQLLIRAGIKFVGNVIADELFVRGGTFDGHAQVKVFFADEPSTLDGTIIAEKSGNKSLNQNVRTDTRAYRAVAPLLSAEMQMETLVDEAIGAAIAQMKDELVTQAASVAEIVNEPVKELVKESVGVESFIAERPRKEAPVNSASERLRAERSQFFSKEEPRAAKANNSLSVESFFLKKPQAESSKSLPSLF